MKYKALRNQNTVPEALSLKTRAARNRGIIRRKVPEEKPTEVSSTVSTEVTSTPPESK